MRPLNISASQAINYYFQTDPIFKDNSRWQGKLAKQFGLHGKIQKSDFANLINGNDLSGKQIIKDGINDTGEQEHRAGIDIPFSAPKSVSILALHVYDAKLIDAHHEAVNTVTNYIENNYIFARKTRNKITRKVKTRKALFGIFPHSVSRNNDPQLHSHMIIFNLTSIDSNFRALSNDLIYKDQILINRIFQNELAKKIRELGYPIISKDNGRWEISGVSQKHIDQYSKRVKDINKTEPELKKLFPNSRKTILRKMAVLDSRQSKNTNIEIQTLWESQVSRNKLKLCVQKAFDKNKNKSKPHEASINDITKSSIKTIQKQKPYFNKRDVLQSVLMRTRGEYSVTDINTAFQKLIRKGEIVICDQQNKKGIVETTYSTPILKKNERNHVQNVIGKQIRPSSKYLLKNPEKERISKNSFTITVKTLKPFSGTRKFFSSNYKIGQKVHIESKLPNFPDSREVTIIDRDLKSNSLKVQTLKGESMDIDLRSQVKVNVFEKKRKNFSKGDRIIFLKNGGKNFNIEKGMTGTIQEIDKKGNLTVNLDGSPQKMKFNSATYNFFDNFNSQSQQKSKRHTGKEFLFAKNLKHYTSNQFKQQLKPSKEKSPALNFPFKYIPKSQTIERGR